jgi:hypothetical protein
VSSFSLPWWIKTILYWSGRAVSRNSPPSIHACFTSE